MSNYIAAANLLTFLMVALFVWACVWSHLAFRRWEERENAKVRALQQIANKLTKQAPNTTTETNNLPEWAATSR